MKNIFKNAIKNIFINWKHPHYSKVLFSFCSRYVDFCYGDYNFDRNTNGENRVVKILVPHSQVVFDVGANDGKYSEYVLSVNPGIKVHAFEPVTQAFNSLKNLPLTANNFALGDKKERRIMHCSTDRSTHNSLYDSSDTMGQKIEIPIETLDDYCFSKDVKHIDFLKIDVEGHEFFVLKGAQKMFKTSSIDFIQFEFSGGSREARTFLKDFIDFFDQYGYDLYRIKPLTIEKVMYYPAKERFTLTNYLAIKRPFPVLPELHAKNHDF